MHGHCSVHMTAESCLGRMEIEIQVLRKLHRKEKQPPKSPYQGDFEMDRYDKEYASFNTVRHSPRLTNASDVAFPLRWGILGAGRISGMWLEALHACAGATVTAVAAREIDRAKAFARQYGVTTAYGDYREMVAADAVDIVYIGTINRLHKEHTLLAIAAGKHVLCEKPLLRNISEAREMYAAAEEKGVMLQDGVWTRFFPAVEHARTEIENGTIGEVVLVQSDFFDPIIRSRQSHSASARMLYRHQLSRR